MSAREQVCDVCGQVDDVANMRRVKVEREVGRSRGTASSTRRGKSFSSSFGRNGSNHRVRAGYSNSSGSRRSERVYTSSQRVWVCSDCPNPSDARSFGKTLVKLVIIGAAAVWLLSVLTSNNEPVSNGVTAPSSFEAGDTAEIDQPSVSSDDEAGTAVAEPTGQAPPVRPRVVFAPAKEVVQQVPGTGDAYPPCTATVTDHCVQAEP